MLKEYESAFKQLQFSILSSVFHQVILCIAPKKTIKTNWILTILCNPARREARSRCTRIMVVVGDVCMLRSNKYMSHPSLLVSDTFGPHVQTHILLDRKAELVFSFLLHYSSLTLCQTLPWLERQKITNRCVSGWIMQWCFDDKRDYWLDSMALKNVFGTWVICCHDDGGLSAFSSGWIHATRTE
jgi:hypothetical protein